MSREKLQDVLAYPPRLLRADRAAAYLDMSERARFCVLFVKADCLSRSVSMVLLRGIGTGSTLVLMMPTTMWLITVSIDCARARSMTDRSKYLDRIGGRIYFRIHGKRQRLPDDATSLEFAVAYDALVAGRDRPREKRRSPNTSGSIGWFIERYLASDYFIARDGRVPKFAPGTQLNYRPVLKSIHGISPSSSATARPIRRPMWDQSTASSKNTSRGPTKCRTALWPPATQTFISLFICCCALGSACATSAL